MRVLAVDTTTPRGSVALLADEALVGEARVAAAEGHSRWLLPAVDALLRGAGWTPFDVDVFAVTCGPGSFTGLRIGLSSVQGLGLAAGRPCVGISALDVLALEAARSGAPVVAAMDAFRGETYLGIYRETGEPVAPARVDVLENAAAVLPRGAAFVGDAAVSQRDRILALVPGARFPPVDLFLAAALARAALARARRGETVAAAALRPVYLRGADARPSRP